MTLNYHKVWNSMNDLESVTSKVCSAREILDSAVDALEHGNREKAETLIYAADEFLQYYLEDFDRKFQIAWKETVTKVKHEEYDASFLSKDRNSNFPNENTVKPKNNKTSLWEKNYFWDSNANYGIDATGDVIKTSEEYKSTQYSDEELKGMCDNAENPKDQYYQEVLEFIDTNTSDYTHK